MWRLSSNKPWKLFERKVAKDFQALGFPNARRTGPKQGMQDEDMDIEGVEGFYIECKYGYPGIISKASEILDNIDQVGERVNALCIGVRHSKALYWLVHSSSLAKLLGRPSVGVNLGNETWNSWKADAWYQKAKGLKKEGDEVILCAKEKGMIGFYAMMDEGAWLRWNGLDGSD